jgi:GTP cyclohydrolase I
VKLDVHRGRLKLHERCARVARHAFANTHATSDHFVTQRRNSRPRANARRAKSSPDPTADRRVDPASLELADFDAGLDLDPGPAPNAEFEALVQRMLELLGEDPTREGLLRTPTRVANALAWLTRGYALDVDHVVGHAVFAEAHESMVMVRDIELYSLCEHHLLPFFGKAHIAYIPNGHIVGLSKLPRIVEVFARRLQVQERLTEQIAQAIQDVLEPRGVGVVIEAYHLCMMMRGVEKQNSKTITSALHGSFRSDARTRDEFLQLAHVSSTPLR